MGAKLDTDNRRNWHLDRALSLPGLLALITQTVGLVWWLASLNTTVTGLVTANTKLELKVEALSANVTTPVALNAARIETLNSRHFILEEQIRQITIELQTVKNELTRRSPRAQ